MHAIHSDPVPAFSLCLGWLLILAGFLSGAALGLGFQRADFLGGYGSFRRRLLRLGHIACVALGMLNVLVALMPASPGPVALAGMAIGGLAMPLVCFLSAWRPAFRHLFALPVAALVTGVLAILFSLPGTVS